MILDGDATERLSWRVVAASCLMPERVASLTASAAVAVAIAIASTGCGKVAFDPFADSALDDDASIAPQLVLRLDFEGNPIDRVAARVPACTSGGCSTYVQGRTGLGLAAAFQGASCLSFPSETAFHLPRFTVAVWFNAAAFANDTLVGKPYDATVSTDNSWELLSVAAGGERLLFATRGGGGNEYLDTADYPVGTWHHLAGTFDGNTKRLYLDGIERDTAVIAALYYDSEPIMIGCDRDGGIDVGQYSGALDEVRLYDEALSAAEIAALAQ